MDSEFDALLDDARDVVARMRGRPDFATVLERVGASHPELEARAEHFDSADERALDAFVAQARDSVAQFSATPQFADVLQRVERVEREFEGVITAARASVSSSAAPPSGAAVNSTRSHRRSQVWVVLAGAAAMLLGGVGYMLLHGYGLGFATSMGVSTPAEQAVHRHNAASEPREAIARSRVRPAVVPEGPPPKVLDESTQEQAEVRVPSIDFDAQMERAQQQWRKGDLRAAVRTLRMIARRTKRAEQAQMAYADLFVLTKQLGDIAGRRSVFRAYLRRFPRGRFSEDARAGLCRLDAAPRACWSNYLKHHPGGAYVGEAQEQSR